METSVDVLPMSAFTRKVIDDAEPLSQNTAPGNLGFGWIYYGLARNLQPKLAVVIGSRRGFTPFCVARGLQDNAAGHLIFIDPSYCGGGHPAWSGAGLWSDPAEVASRIAAFGLTGWMTHLKLTSEEAFPHVRALVPDAPLSLVVVDGAHTHEQSLQDFELYASLMSNGYVLFHDSTNVACDVSRTVDVLRTRGHPVVTIERDVGLTIVQVTHAPSVENTWGYLCRPSNRGHLIEPFARRSIRPGDAVLEIYCGYSPLAGLLTDVQITGCDRDEKIIEKLRATHPSHRWLQIDERSMPFAELPEHIDVLIGLGLSRGQAPWDPQHVLDNVRYLIGRYFPRACLFETAADYDAASILHDVAGALRPFDYRLRRELIETDMNAYSRRALLLASRV